jgi:hypothetical protein
MVLAAVVARANLERQGDVVSPGDTGRSQPLAWLKAIGAAAELEGSERAFLKRALGRADSKVVTSALWRSEGLAVLAWAIGRFSLPPYYVPVDPAAPAQAAVAFGDQHEAQELLDRAALRPAAEIARFATHITVVSWRLRQFLIQPGPMDLVAFLRAFSSFNESWLDELVLVDGDLAIGAQAISRASAEEIQRCRSAATERHIAAYWLQGDDPVYSSVDPVTLLSTC